VHSTREGVLAELRGGIWHTTNQSRFTQILEAGAILPEPDIPERERWGTARGSDGHSYVRSIGGISLFDFRNFDAEVYEAKVPGNSLGYFVPCCSQWDSAVWIEIDEGLTPAFISGVALLARRDAEGSCRRIMALIEAAHIGPLPSAAFKRCFSARNPPDGGLAAILKAGRLKALKRVQPTDL
jgi:hypothetical protein